MSVHTKTACPRGSRHADAGHAAPFIARANDDEHARRRSLKGSGVYREWMDFRLTPKGSTMDISTFLVFIVGLGAMLAAGLAP
jgi:hypothetical protein